MIMSGYSYCPHCGSKVDTKNTSGEGYSAIVPNEVKGWNWGAFFLPVIWGIFNQVWLSLLALAPVANVVMPFILGVKGNEWAWQYKRWDSVEHFRRAQRTWMYWGIATFVAPVILVVGVAMIVFGFLKYYGYLG